MTAIFSWLVTNALIATALVPLVGVAAWGCRRRPAVAHLLWLLLLAKLVMPPVVVWPWSVVELSQSWKGSESLSVAATSVTTAADEKMSAAGREPAADMAFSEHAGGERNPNHEPAQAKPTQHPGPPRENAESHTLNRSVPLFSALLVAWSVGMGIAACRLLRMLGRQRLLIRECDAAPAELVDAVSRLAARLGVRPPHLNISYRVNSPVVCCFGRPRLIWPADMREVHHVADAGGVLAHELAHLIRRDHWVLRLELAAATCCWWNPLLWFIRRRLHETRELACDAIAIAAADQDRGAYARKLLTLSTGSPNFHAIAPSFGAASRSPRLLKRRLIMVFDSRVRGRMSAAGLVGALPLLAAGLPGLTLAHAQSSAQATVAESSESADAGPTTDAESAASPWEQSSQAGNGVIATSSESAVNANAEQNFSNRQGARQLRLWHSSTLLSDSDLEGTETREIKFPGGGGVVRISRNAQGNLVVVVDQSDADDQNQGQQAHRPLTSSISTAGGPSTRQNSQTASLTLSSVDAPPGGPAVAGNTAFGATSSGWQTNDSGRGQTAVGTTIDGVATGSTDSANSSVDREMLQLDMELASVNVEEKKAEFDRASVGAKSGAVTDSELRLAELAVHRAEIELRRAKLRLERPVASTPRR